MSGYGAAAKGVETYMNYMAKQKQMEQDAKENVAKGWRDSAKIMQMQTNSAVQSFMQAKRSAGQGAGMMANTTRR